ncbi:proton-conducting transporter membrane subunit [Sorangium sp. So ce1036]|uniref:complex I subunit 5 family protein n=1 Tax=Sorangium sp. So ce1036 TaxID=3133328 RepID=UPI003EFC9C76
MSPELAASILVPLIGAVLCLLSGPRGERWAFGATILGTAGVVSSVAWSVATRGPLRHAVGGWGAPLGIELRADGLAAVMLLVAGVVGALTSAQAILDGRADRRPAGRFFAIWLAAWAALNALVLSADIFNLYVTLEVTTLAAVGLIAVDDDRDALSAGLRYLLVALPGSLIYLLGVAILYGTYATLDLSILGARLSSDLATRAALALLTLGLCLKAALFPLHAWLPPSYVSARSTVSAFVAALVGKGAFYILLRIWLAAFPADLAPRVGQVLGALGAASVVWGALLALRQRRLKALIAYSSISQLGYFFLLFPLDTPGAWSGSVYMAISHAAAKASMFLAAGTIHRAVGHDDLDGLRGLSEQLPLTSCSLVLAGVSLMGMPPSGGFVAKWLLVRAAMERGAWWLAVVVLAGGLLAAGYVFRMLRRTLRPSPRDARPCPPPRREELAAFALALFALLLGVAPEAPLELLLVRLPS